VLACTPQLRPQERLCWIVGLFYLLHLAMANAAPVDGGYFHINDGSHGDLVGVVGLVAAQLRAHTRSVPEYRDDVYLRDHEVEDD